MTLAEFKRSLAKRTPPAGLAPALKGLWWAGKNKDFISVGRYHAVVLTGVQEIAGSLSLLINDPWPVKQGATRTYKWESFQKDLPGLGLMSFP